MAFTIVGHVREDGSNPRGAHIGLKGREVK